MAIYRLEAKVISRGKQGYSAVAASAYRTGTKLKDERSGRTHDYSRRTKGVVDTTILSPNDTLAWTRNSAELWNRVEASEKRVDAQLAREFILAVPRELTSQEQFDAAIGWAQRELVAPGMVVEVSLHQPRDGKNPHIHILCTMRKLEGEGFSPLKAREWNSKAQLHRWRETWCDAENAALEKAGRPERVDHRSLKDQGIDRIPQPKLGQEAVAMKRQGIEADPVRFQLVRDVKMANEVRPLMKAILADGEVSQIDAPVGFWEKSFHWISDIGHRAKEAISNIWSKLLDGSHGKRHSKGPKADSDMAIPDHLKSKAMDAVSHKETTDFIRSFGAQDKQADFTHREYPLPEADPLHGVAKSKAKDAILHPETQSQIHLMKETGDITAPITLSRGTDRIASKIAQMHIAEQGLDKTHRTMTQDGFGREL